MKNIFILHPGKANYPDILAYKEYFSEKYNVLDGTLSDYSIFPDKRNTIVWCIMGFYPKKIDCAYLIHDYRSLSVGRFSKAKDIFKKFFNIRPNLRIFQNIIMQKEMGFNDNVKSVILPMGVPDFVFDIGKESFNDKVAKFCYIGEMSYERGFDKLLDSYLENEFHDQFLLIGEPHQDIKEKYSKYECFDFVGRKSQLETLRLVKQCEYAVCFFPYHRPHCFQTPTKFLEYAALNMKIVGNDAPSNIRVSEEIGYPFLISSAFIFDSFLYDKVNSLDGYSFENSDDIDMRSVSWRSVISTSGIEEQLRLSAHE